MNPHSKSDEVSLAGVADEAFVIAQALDRWTGRIGREFGPLSRRQRRTLRTLHDLGKARAQVRVSDLAGDLGITSAGATRMLNKLEELGYVARVREPEGDQREVAVSLTLSGTRALDEADNVYFERVREALQRLDPEEQQMLAHLLGKLIGSGTEIREQ